MTLTVGSLFSGIGGIDLGLERAGMRVIWQSEIDPYASRVLAKHWPGVPNLGDITEIDWSTVERPALLCGGFPCQPVSHAGRRRAQDDERWLWPEFARCLSELRPRHAIMENVPGLLTAGMGNVLGDLAALGYDAEWDCIPAAAVGAPHLRYRVLIVAHANGERSQGYGRPDSDNREVPERHVPGPAGLAGRTRTLADADSERSQGWLFGQWRPGEWTSWPGSLSVPRHWQSEPDVGRVAHGIPRRVDRLRCLGNAVVPQVAEWIGRELAAHIDGDPNG